MRFFVKKKYCQELAGYVEPFNPHCLTSIDIETNVVIAPRYRDSQYEREKNSIKEWDPLILRCPGDLINLLIRYFVVYIFSRERSI